MRRLLPILLLLLAACTPATSPSAAAPKRVSFAILEDYDKGQPLSGVEADFRRMEELGFHEWRGSFGWDDYEPERGRYDFEWLHRFVDLAARHHLRLHPYLGYTPEWAARGHGATREAWNDPPRNLDDWSQFAGRMGAEMRRHPNVVSFEIYNEENAPLWWDGSAQDYSRVLVTGADALRRADPGVKILFGGMVFPDLAWVTDVCDAGAGHVFDILPIHAYPETWFPPEVTVENYLAPRNFHGRFLPEVDRRCGAKTIWINEAGFATVPGRTTERDQANWWARAFATFLADPRVEELGVYQLKDRPVEATVIGEPENHYLGLIGADGHEKLAFHTVQLLLRLLDTGAITTADDEATIEIVGGKAGELHHHLFIRPDGRRVLFLWDRIAAPLLKVRLHGSANAIEYALDGSASRQTLEHPIQLTAGDVKIFLLE